MTIPSDYYSILARIESNNNPNAKARTSSASGLYQFLKSTWTSLGYAWNDVFNVDLQNQAIAKLTQQNANVLSRGGVDINSGSLYAAHFFGASTAKKVLGASDDTPVSSLVSQGVMNANSFLKGMTVGDFKNWLTRKTGASMSGSDSIIPSIPSLVDFHSGIFGAMGDAGDAILNAGDTVVNGPSDLIAWLKNLFSFHTAARASAVVIGIILVALAIAAFVLTSDTTKSVVKLSAAAV